MKVLICHNCYRLESGEDIVFVNETELLRRHGHQVIEYARANNEIDKLGVVQNIELAAKAVWNWRSYRQVRDIILKHRPDIAHFHNTLPLISSAAYDACVEHGVPVIQSLHNARLFCPQGSMYYGGGHCEVCIGRSLPWHGIARACYRKSHMQSALIGITTAVNWKRGVWTDKIDRYIVFNSFYREKFIQAGLPAEKIVLKPHSVEDPGPVVEPGGYVLYAGRLTEAKGVSILLRAWGKSGRIPLKLCGEGELECEVGRLVKTSAGGIEWFGHVPRKRVIELIKGAAFLIWPSWNETFGLIALEAFACGRAVISSRVPPMSELVEDNRTGIVFRAGDADDLADKVGWAWAHPEEMRRMGCEARKKYEANYSAEANYKTLIGIYSDVIKGKKRASGAVSNRSFLT